MVSLWPVICVFLPGILIVQPLIPGGPQNVPVNRTDVIEMADFSVDKYNEKSTDEYLVNDIQIIKATMQVIAGRRYALDVLIGQAKCKKNSLPKKKCCHFVVVVPLLRRKELEKITCSRHWSFWPKCPL
ncbi:CYT protein, partial [Polypterus senegalus]